MKTLDLNIKFEVPEDQKPEDVMENYDVAIMYIDRMVTRSINKPVLDTRTNQWVPSVMPDMAVQRKYGKLMTALEAHKKGIALLEDDTFEFMQSKWNKAGMAVQRDINKILLELDRAIDLAKVETKKPGPVGPTGA